jgi:rSAM/selenodomain-associated transferase 2
MATVSVIVPVWNEAPQLQALRPTLMDMQARGHEVIVVDGASTDGSGEAARLVTPKVIASTRGRARQMNAGAVSASGEVLLFLHADTSIDAAVLDALASAYAARGDKLWGRFDVRLAGRHRFYRVIEFFMNLRSRLTGIATGDQAIFVSRGLFEKIGGYPEIPLMEDIALSRKLRKSARPLCLRERAVASTRRWARHGILFTTLLMWRLRLAYFLGADPQRLASIYYGPEIRPDR